MKPMLLAAVGVLMAMPCAHAQQAPRSPDPADPGVAVPPPAYESAMAGYSRLPQDSGPTPDKTWRQVNEAVAAPSAHAGHGAPQAPAKPAQPAMPADHKHHEHHEHKAKP